MLLPVHGPTNPWLQMLCIEIFLHFLAPACDLSPKKSHTGIFFEKKVDKIRLRMYNSNMEDKDVSEMKSQGIFVFFYFS